MVGILYLGILFMSFYPDIDSIVLLYSFVVFVLPAWGNIFSSTVDIFRVPPSRPLQEVLTYYSTLGSKPSVG